MENGRIFGVGLTVIIVGIVLLAIPGVPGNVYGTVGEDADYYLLKFSEFPTDGIKSEFSAAYGMSFIEYHQDNTYLVRITNGFANRLAACNFISNLAVYSPAEKISSELKNMGGQIKLRINIHQGEDVGTVADQLRSMGAIVTRENIQSLNYIECSANAQDIEAMANLKSISSIQLDGEKQTHMNLIQSNTYMGIDYVQTAAIPFRGSGMLAEVQDNGCDRSHPDLTQVDYTDGAAVSDDHGTCTTGIVFATGAQSANAQGICYQATGVFADWGTGRTTSVTNLWNGDFNEGMVGLNGVMQSNSWSQGALDGTYTTYSNEDDTVAFNFPKVLTLWAAGNSNSGTGVGLITQDSANKNGMCIGAIFHKDTAAMGDDDYHDAGSGMTPSRGPAADGRMKPDMCAAFDWIYTVDMVGSAGYTSTNYYDDFGGTSGATPTVAGCTLQAYEMYQENFFDNNPTNEIPYSATIKALMIADAYQYPIGTNAITRNVQGWGTPDMENMYNLGPNYHVFNERPQALSSGSTWSRNVYSDGTKPLKISVAWTDPAAPSTTGAGRALINNLDLKVTSPTGTVYWGNNGLWSNIWSVSGTGTNDWSRTNPAYTDDENNVENVFVQSPAAGIWTVEVQGAVGDVAQGPQHFSMVASGAMPISGVGTIALDKVKYQLPATIEVTVQDLDLNINPAGINTVGINIASTLEPAGESLTLTETGVDTSTFVGTISLSATNSVGVLWGAHGNLITATYNDADAGGSGPASVTDTATVDAQVLSATGLTVDWYGATTKTWINEPFASFPPTGWQVSSSGTTGSWSGSATVNAGGTSPEARFMYGISGTGTSRLYCGPFDTTGRTQLDLQFRTMYDAYATGVTVKVQTSTNAVTWTDTGWALIDRTTNLAASLITEPISTAEGAGSASLYIAFVVDRNSYQLDYWYVDSVLMTSSGESATADNWLNWTKSGDDGAGANDVTHYNIYRSSSSSGPWDATTIVKTVPAGTATWTDVDKGEPDGINWYYVVRAVDSAGNIDTNTNAVPEEATGSGATATANGPIGGPSNVAGVTITYSYTGTPTSIRLFRTTNGGTTWTLLGTDSSVDGSYAYTIPAAGTYGWIAVAVGGSTTEIDPVGGTAPEAASYILDLTAPTAPTDLTVDWWGSIFGMATYTYTGVTQASTNHTAWFCDVDDSTPAELTTPNSQVELTDAQYGNLVTSNDVRAASIDPGAGDEIFTKSSFTINQASSSVTAIDLTMEIQSNLASTFSIFAYDFIGTTWVQVGATTASIAANTDTTILRSITTGASNYVSTSNEVRWGCYQTTSTELVRVDYAMIQVTYNEYSDINDNTLNWTHSGADVDHYNVYRSDAEFGTYTLIDSVPAGTNTYQDNGMGQADTTRWWYRVRSVDTATNEEANTNSVPEPAITMPYSISLAGKTAGQWVFVSFPSALSGNIQDILNDATAGDGGTTWSIAKWYNGQTKTWTSYRATGVQTLTTINNQMGVWLFLTANGGDQTLTLSSYVAPPAAAVNINLYTGWNLVGYPSMTARTGTATLPAQADQVAVWQAATPYITDLAPGSVTMSHGNAYWVRVTADCVWTVNP